MRKKKPVYFISKKEGQVYFEQHCRYDKKICCVSMGYLEHFPITIIFLYTDYIQPSLQEICNIKPISIPCVTDDNCPPCKRCHRHTDTCNCRRRMLYNSVLAQSDLVFREFIVYENFACFPDYLITYVRV